MTEKRILFEGFEFPIIYFVITMNGEGEHFCFGAESCGRKSNIHSRSLGKYTVGGQKHPPHRRNSK